MSIFPKTSGKRPGADLEAIQTDMSLVDLGKRLLDAAKRGDTDEVRTLMSNGAPFTTDWLGTSPLHFSAQYGHLTTAEVLLRAGISRDARTKVDRTPLHVAAQEGHVDIVNLLLQHSADIEAKDMLKMTPLHWATEKGHIGVIETLLKSGSDINCDNKFDRSPLDIAIMNGRPDIVQIIQLAQHTEINSLADGDTVTVETSEVTEDVVIPETEAISIETNHDIGLVKSVDSPVPVTVVPNVSSEVTSDTVESGGESGSSTSVLATLAALAEATAPNNAQNVSTSEAMNWLESQGITMITTADGNIITSAVESGQTITLTEAGKIALNIIKQQGLNPQTGELITADDTTPVSGESDVTEKVITIVAAQPASAADMTTDTGLVTTLSSDGTTTEVTTDTIVPETIIETVADDFVHTEDAADTAEESTLIPTDQTEDPQDSEEPVLKKLRTDEDSLLEKQDDGDEDQEAAMRRQLEEFKRQAEEYKEQLKQKDKDLEQYKRKLGEMPDNADSTDT